MAPATTPRINPHMAAPHCRHDCGPHVALVVSPRSSRRSAQQRAYQWALGPRGGEGIALARIPGLEAAPEPANPLRRGSVRERFGRHAPPALLLQTVVADRRRRPEGFLEIARLENLTALGVMPPHAGEAVRLELLLDGERIAVARPRPVAGGLDPLGDPEQRLDVMPYLVRDDVRLCEISGRHEAILQRPEE